MQDTEQSEYMQWVADVEVVQVGIYYIQYIKIFSSFIITTMVTIYICEGGADETVTAQSHKFDENSVWN